MEAEQSEADPSQFAHRSPRSSALSVALASASLQSQRDSTDQHSAARGLVRWVGTQTGIGNQSERIVGAAALSVWSSAITTRVSKRRKIKTNCSNSCCPLSDATNAQLRKTPTVSCSLKMKRTHSTETGSVSIGRRSAPPRPTRTGTQAFSSFGDVRRA